MEFERIILGEFIEHDDNSCRAWGEFLSLPYQARYYDMMAIATKYNTTPQQMKEHKKCFRNSF